MKSPAQLEHDDVQQVPGQERDRRREDEAAVAAPQLGELGSRVQPVVDGVVARGLLLVMSRIESFRTGSPGCDRRHRGTGHSPRGRGARRRVGRWASSVAQRSVSYDERSTRRSGQALSSAQATLPPRVESQPDRADRTATMAMPRPSWSPGSAWWIAWPRARPVLHRHPHDVTGPHQRGPERRAAVGDRVGRELGRDEDGVADEVVEAPPGECLTNEAADGADGRGDGQVHAGPDDVAVRWSSRRRPGAARPG